MTAKKRIDTGGGNPLEQNPFGGLDELGLKLQPDRVRDTKGKAGATEGRRGQAVRPGRRGRIEIRREKSGRGGKIVTVASGFLGVSSAEHQEWIRELKRTCGTGGTTRPGVIEIQGDRREELMRFFAEKGFRPVLTGG